MARLGVLYIFDGIYYHADNLGTSVNSVSALGFICVRYHRQVCGHYRDRRRSVGSVLNVCQVVRRSKIKKPYYEKRPKNQNQGSICLFTDAYLFIHTL